MRPMIVRQTPGFQAPLPSSSTRPHPEVSAKKLIKPEELYAQSLVQGRGQRILLIKVLVEGQRKPAVAVFKGPQ